MELRGFDSYTVTLGDELRGERACRGWTLKDAARELCMKASMIEAIENGDLSAFPNRSVVPGYVRSYARYLGLDDNEIYARFCEESGFESSLVTYGMIGGAQPAEPARRELGGARAGVGGMGLSGAVGADLTASRFAVRPAPRRIGAAVSLGGLVSSVALTLLIGGVGYGAYTVLQDIQRVGFVPLPDAPAVVADAPEIDAPVFEVAEAPAIRRPDARDYADGGALMGLGLADAARFAARRDGPISAIDPAAAGILTIEPTPSIAEMRRDLPLDLASLPDAAREEIREIALLRSGIVDPSAAPSDTEISAAETTPPVPSAVRGTSIVAVEPAWIRIRAEDRSVLFEGTLRTGDSFALPKDTQLAQLRAGNAGGVYVVVDGRRYGPLGRAGQVVKGVSLQADSIMASYGLATENAGDTTVATTARSDP
ncbi:MAG: helix-turn-helix domain-containing protein [Pseudomonadota bacterium]